jgi:hypothetical protein
MSTSPPARYTRDFTLGSRARQAMERRVLEVQAELAKVGRRARAIHQQEPVARRVTATAREELSGG